MDTKYFLWEAFYNVEQCDETPFPVGSLELPDELTPSEFMNGAKVGRVKAHVSLEDDEYTAWADVFILDVGPFLVSRRLRDLLESEAPGEAQFIPTDIWLDSKGKKVKRGYCILVSLGLEDCIDLSKTPHKIKDGEVDILFNFTLDRARISEHRRLFRLKHNDIVTIMRQDLKDIIEESGFTGFQFQEVPVSR